MSVPTQPPPGTDEKRTPQQWAAAAGKQILDPDGWREPNSPPFDEPLTFAEFSPRFASCTIGPLNIGSGSTQPPGISDEALMAANGELRRQERATGVTGLLVLVDASAILTAALPHLRAAIADEIEALAPYNCELRPDGSENREVAAWVRGISDAARVARGGPTE